MIKDGRYKLVRRESGAAATWYWDHSAPGVLWHNQAAIGNALDHGVDVASSTAGHLEHGLSHAWHSVI